MAIAFAAGVSAAVLLAGMPAIADAEQPARHAVRSGRHAARSARHAAKPAHPAPLTLSPEPGTPDANPATQISILGPAPATIRSVRVTGSQSGAHAGRLRAYSGERGASFVLVKPLSQGERVRVRIKIAGRKQISYAFSVARLGTVQPVLNIPAVQPDKLDHFASEPSLLPPVITVNKRSPKLGGDIFLTPLPSPEIHPESNNALTIKPVGPGGAMIIAPSGRLVWFHQVAPPDVAANFRPQMYKGHEVLTWWQGGVTPAAFGIGEGVIASTSYRILKTVKVGNGYAADIHEFLLTKDGDALFTAYSPVLVHLPGTAAGTLSPLLDSMVQEVDVKTGLVTWEWHGLGHIPLADSYATPAASASYDVYHLNSIELLPHDRVLVSARDTCAIYEIDRSTGRILWTLGGKASTFKLGPGTRFYFQHDAQMLGSNEVSLFDDEAGPPLEAASSRGLILKLDYAHRRTTVAKQFTRPGEDTLANSEGSFQTLPSGNIFLGFGSNQFFSAFSPAGRMVYDANLPVDDGSYRTYVFPWSATPNTRPVIAVKRTSGSAVSVAISWNGATTAGRWQVLAGDSASSLKPVATVGASGFETTAAINTSASQFAARALDAHGKPLATSEPVAASS